MLKIYGIKNCSTMKKAFDVLNELGLAYEFHDYKKQGIDAKTVKTWLNSKGQDVILNKKGIVVDSISSPRSADEIAQKIKENL